jgi:photosystem II stability/assembly factor-like uncharacterized protein
MAGLQGRRLGRWAAAACAALLAGRATPAASQKGSWTPLGPPAATVFALERDPFNAARLYAGTYAGGLYRSDDRGLTWTHRPSAFSPDSVSAIALDPVRQGTLYVGTYTKGVFLSQNGGLSWSARNGGLTTSAIEALAVDPGRPDTVLAATFAGVFRTTDGGTSWVLSNGGIDPLPGRSLLFDRRQPGLVFLGTSGRGAFRSRDSGLSWEAFQDGMGDKVVTALVPDPRGTGAVYAAAGDRVFHTDGTEAGWEDLTFDLPTGTFVNDVELYPGGLLAATNTGVFRLDAGSGGHWTSWAARGARLLLSEPGGPLIHVASTFGILEVTQDDGATFQRADQGIQNRFVGAVATADRAGQTTVYAGTDRGLEINGGVGASVPAPWTSQLAFPGAVFDVQADPSAPGTLYAGTETRGAWKSRDFGATWSPISRGLAPTRVTSLDQAATGRHTLYVGTTFGIYVSQDDGHTWGTDTTGIPRLVTAVVADPVRVDVAYYGTTTGQVFRTLDAGASFQPVWPGEGEAILQMDAARFFNIYAVTASRKLYTSEDLGASFFRRAQEIPYDIVAVAAEQARPWYAYVGTVSGGVYKTETNAIRWEARNEGIDNPTILSLAIDQADPDVVYAGSVGKVFKTTNGGDSWTSASDGLPPGFVTHLELDPDNPQTIYACVHDAGLWKSADGGASWARLVTGAPFEGSVPVEVSRTEPGVVFAGTANAGLFRSGDGGATWAPGSEGMTLFVKGLAVDPVSSDTVYAATLATGLYKTTDGGTNWTRKGLADRILFHVTVDPRNPATVYASATRGVSRSRDGGETWDDLGQKTAWVFDVASSPADRTLVLAAGLGGALYKSTDGGQLWRESRQGLPERNILALGFDPTATVVYAGTDHAGVYESRDGGETWQPTGALPVEAQVTGLTVGRGLLFASTSGQGLFRSTDGGATWAEATGIASPVLSAVVFDPFDSGRVIASTLNSPGGAEPGVYVSSDQGTTFRAAASGLVSTTVYGIAADPRQQGVYFASAADGLYRSSNGGESWAPWGNGLPAGAARTLVVDGAVAGLVYAATDARGVYRSTDGGSTWSVTTAPFPGLSVTRFAPAPEPGACYAASLGHGVLDNRSAVDRWTGGTEAALTSVVVFRVEIDPRDSNHLFAATGGGGVAVSRDAGLHWASANQGLPDLFVLSLAIDPANPQTLYAGTSVAGAFVSRDGAATWRPLNKGLFNPKVTALHVDSLHGTVYAGTEGGGLFRLDP